MRCHSLSKISASLVLATLFIATTAIAASGSEMDEGSSSSVVGTGTITIDQKNSAGEGAIGKWLLIMPANEEKTGGNSETTLDSVPTGNYTIFLTLPTGASSTIRIYRNGKEESVVPLPQTSFKVGNGDALRIIVHYTITKVGLVAVDSDPQGIDFEMTGPNNTTLHGTTPTSFDGIAEGQYQVHYAKLAGCILPAPKSLKLTAGDRISFTLRISCDAADRMRLLQETQNSNKQNITINDDGINVVMRDVPTSAWFAQFVVSAAKAEILTGYRKDDGTLTGEFGPENNVTIAELSKIAHKITGFSVDSFLTREPSNPLARGKWFSPFVASSEDRGWTIYTSEDIDPTRPATRGEVVITLLQALDVPLAWQKGNMFTDVNVRTPYAAAIETAASAKVVQGRMDANGKSLNLFAPTDPINRAEMAKIVKVLIDTYRSVSTSSAGTK